MPAGIQLPVVKSLFCLLQYRYTWQEASRVFFCSGYPLWSMGKSSHDRNFSSNSICHRCCLTGTISPHPICNWDKASLYEYEVKIFCYWSKVDDKFDLNHYLTYGQVTDWSPMTVVDYLLKDFTYFGFATWESITPYSEVPHQFI